MLLCLGLASMCAVRSRRIIHVRENHSSGIRGGIVRGISK
ncbi:hypothetical protein EBAPG3_14885 [Nitrosospira lacus]|nr:hypothetical protein EBAPG3_14885 [Nitrosospira lacus]